VRIPGLAAAALAGLAGGCTEAAALLPAPAEVFRLETWTTVPEGPEEVKGSVGDVLHLPLPPDTERTSLVWLTVSVNGRPVAVPEFETSANRICYVFRARQAGRYRVEVRREFARQPDLTGGVTPAPSLAPMRSEDASWPARVWNITISG
jgi:hypothetical protein